METANTATGVSARYFGDNDTLLRQHCLELAIKRLADASVATAVYEKNALTIAKEYYDFIKGTGKDPRQPPQTDGQSVMPCSRPNLFEASAEPGKPASGGSILYSRIGGWTIEVVPYADAPSGIDAVAKDGSDIPFGKYRAYTEIRFERISQ